LLRASIPPHYHGTTGAAPRCRAGSIHRRGSRDFLEIGGDLIVRLIPRPLTKNRTRAGAWPLWPTKRLEIDIGLKRFGLKRPDLQVGLGRGGDRIGFNP